MWFTRLSIKNPVFASMMMVALVVAGLFSYKRLPIEQMPNVDIPVAVIATSYPGASPEIIESEISRPIEDKLSTISGIKNIRSDSFNGQSVVVAEFELTTNLDQAMKDVRDKVDEAKVKFRKEVKDPAITRVRNTDGPVISVALTSDRLTEGQMTTRADQDLQHRFQTIKGVGSVSVVGGVKRQLRIEVQPDKLRALGIGVDQVVSALETENQEVPVGNVEYDNTERIVQVRGRLVDAQDFASIVVARRNGQPILLSQVATVLDAEEEHTSLALVNGKRSVSLDIRKVDGANTIQVTDDIKAMVTKINEELGPDGLQLQIVDDTSVGIRRSLTDVRDTLIEGAALTVVIVWLFLGSWRSTVITGLTLPVALIGTFFFLELFGFTINMMTLMALSLCVGLLIDDAIVVRENIVRHGEMGKGHYQAALDGTAEIGLAVLATTLTIVAVFLPVGFMGGIIGRFFFQFGIAVCSAVLISMFVSFTLDPMLSSVWHDPQAHGQRQGGWIGRVLDGFQRLLDAVSDRYGRIIRWALLHRKSTLAIAAGSLVLAFAIPAVGLVGAEFMPKADISRVAIEFRTPIGSTLDYSASKSAQVEAALHEFPEIESMYTTINTGDSGGKHIMITNLRLIDKHKRVSQQVVIKRIRERLARIGGIDVRSVGEPGGGGGGGAPVSITVQGKDLGTLRQIAETVEARLKHVPHLTDVHTTLRDAKPSIDINVNRQMASAVGLSVGRIGAALRPFVAGDPRDANWKAPDGEVYDVVVQLPKSNRRVAEDLADLPIASEDTDPRTGQPLMVPLSQVAEVKESGTSTLINRRNLFRDVEITADVQGVPVGAVQADVQKVLDSVRLPSGYQFVQEGESRDMEESAGYAFSALIMGVLLIYLVLASQFSSVTQPLAIMTSLPLSLVGVFLSLMMWRSTLNLFSIIGVIMLMGLVTKNAILLIDFVNRLRADGVDRFEAIVEAGKVRLRPILMTTFAMIGGMLPMALALGEASERRAPMAHAIIGGVVTSTLLTLIVVPVVFTYLDDFGAWCRRLVFGRKAKTAPVDTLVPQESMK